MQTDTDYLSRAILQAIRGKDEDGIPIGSVLVNEHGIIIGEGRNRRVQASNPIMHAEIDCLQNAGRIGSYKGTTLYSTLMPCYMCAGAIVQFRIRKVVVGESKTFFGARVFLERNGVRVIDLQNKFCEEMMAKFIMEKPELWNEDIGGLQCLN